MGHIEDHSRWWCNFKNDCREEDVYTQAIHPNKTTSALSLMGPEAVERVAEVRDMEAVLKWAFSVTADSSGACLMSMMSEM